MNVQRIKQFFFGKPLDPFQADTRKHLALITFFAWVGIGADGLSSANYGPAVAFLALGDLVENFSHSTMEMVWNFLRSSADQLWMVTSPRA